MNSNSRNKNKKPPRSSESTTKFIQPARKRGLLIRIRTYFLTGIVVSAPVGITIWLIWLFVAFVDSSVVPLIPENYNPSNVSQPHIENKQAEQNITQSIDNFIEKDQRSSY